MSIAAALLAGATGAVIAGSQAGAATATYVEKQNAYDAMSRSSVNGLGSADVGGAYSVSSPSSVFSVTTDAAHISGLAPGAQARATLSGVVAADEHLRTAFSIRSLPTVGNGSYISVELRRQANGDAYGARVRIAPGGQLFLGLTVTHDNVEANPGGETLLPQLVSAGETIFLEGQAVGSSAVTLNASAWLASTARPAWQANRIDTTPGSLAKSGTIGLTAYESRSSSAATLDFYILQGWSLTAAGSGTTPIAKPTASSSTPKPVSSSTSAAPVPTKATSTSTVPTVTSAPVAPTAQPSRGSLAVGSASYAVPSGALFVSTAGNDSAAGAVSAPMRTVQAAVDRASAGQTIVVRAGTYHESVFVKTGKNLTIQAYPKEAVWLDGSTAVSGWTQQGSTWVHGGWTAQFDHSASFTTGSNAGGFVNPAYPLAAYPDQLFMDGVQFTQVSGAPAAGQFAVNYGAQTLTIGSNPAGHAVRASDLAQAVLAAGRVTLRGFGVERYATPLPKLGTIFLGGAAGGDVLENLVIDSNATQGLSLDTANVLVNRVTITRNGMTGVHTNGANGGTVENSILDSNNTQYFNCAPAGAGIKISRTTGFVVRNNEVKNNNNVSGIWTDENTVNFTIVGNDVASNGRQYGIETELSANGVVADNSVSGAKYGYTAFDSGTIKVFNNDFSDNSVWDVGLTQDNRYQPGKGTAGASVQPSAANPWLVRNITVDDNLFSGGAGSFQFYALDNQTNRPASSMNIDIEGNQFTARNGTSGSWLAGWGAADNHTVAFIATPAALDAGVGKSWANAQVAIGSSAIVAAASAAVAVALPSDVASAVGVATGTKHIGTF